MAGNDEKAEHTREVSDEVESGQQICNQSSKISNWSWVKQTYRDQVSFLERSSQ